MFFQYGQVPVYYSVEGGGPPLLLMHGWGADSRSFAGVAARYSAHFTVIALDFPPFGLSGVLDKDYTVSDYADLVFALLRELGIEETKALVHSFGGRVAAVMAARRPELFGGIVLTGAAGVPAKKTFKKKLNKLRFRFAKFLVKLRLKKKASLKKFYSADYLALPDSMKQTFRNVIGEDLTPFIAQIKCPCLLLWGRDDRETPPYMAQRYKALVKNSELQFLKGGHYAFLDDPAGFYQKTDRFLDMV